MASWKVVLPASLVLGALFRRESAAVTVVAGLLLALGLFLAHPLQPLLAAIAAVGVAVFNQPIGPMPVDRQALALEIGAVVAAHQRPLVPLAAQPAQARAEIVQGILHQPLLVGVLDAQDELAVTVAGKEPVEQRRAGRADVQVAGRAGGEAYADGFVAHG
jgi:hypothetical protein